MPPPKPPSRVDALTFPVFGMCWYGSPADPPINNNNNNGPPTPNGAMPPGKSIVAYCGGGGSAATGVKNFIVLQIPLHINDVYIPTGNEVAVGIHIVQDPISKQIQMVVAMGSQIVHYYLYPDKEEDECYELKNKVQTGDGLNCIAMNAMANKIAVGSESGVVKIYQVDTSTHTIQPLPIHTCEGHTKAVCAVSFSIHNELLVSSAKDGTAIVWRKGKAACSLKCSIEDPKSPPPKRTPQVLVRGCAFGDLQGKIIYTVASGRRGKAFLSKWCLTKEKVYDCNIRTECSKCPISAMSLSNDTGLLALGSVDGSIILWATNSWRPITTFSEVHDLPVTCIAARPFPIPLDCDADNENGIQMHAISASADSKLARLSLQRPIRKRRGYGFLKLSLKGLINFILRMVLLYFALLVPIQKEFMNNCKDQWRHVDYMKDISSVFQDKELWECVVSNVFIAPSTRPGIITPPH